MLKENLKHLTTAFLLLLVLTLITGIIYPAMVTGFAQLFFPWKANGSLIRLNNITVGSVLIGQSFTNNNYFWGRPSATIPFPYNAENSSGSNLGPTNLELLKLVAARSKKLIATELIPVDLVTASASGLDPDISPYAAYYQIPRIAKARGIPEEYLQNLVLKLTNPCTFGILGEPRINVLKLNLALDSVKK